MQPVARASSIFEKAVAGLVLPTAVTPYGKDRYVLADAALQRIFVLAPDGTTRVLAGGGAPNALGSAPGGYADGNGERARFNAPQGVVADAMGNVYVSDTGNHCVRKITRDGTVSTLAGNPMHEGSRDGTRRSATLYAPRGIAFDLNGDLLVADGVGVRRISQSGEVRTLPFPVNTPFDVTLLNGEGGVRRYVVSDLDGLLVVAPNGVFARYASEPGTKNSWRTIGGVSIGHPYALAGYGSHRVAYTDRYTNIIRVIDIDIGYVESISGAADVAVALSEPLGVRLLPDSADIVIVDAGRRRLRILRLGNDRAPFSPSAGRAFPPAPKPTTERITLIGNSMVWWATDWPGSIEGQAERILNAASDARPVEVLPISSPASSAAAQLSYAGEFCEAHLADIVALNLNSGVVRDSYSFSGPVSSPAAIAAWAAQLRAAVAQVATTCRAAGVRFVVVINPLSDEVSSNEDALRRLLANDLTTDSGVHARFLEALHGLPVIDLWPAFMAAEAANGGDHPALYLTADAHLSAAGRYVFAAAFADAIEHLPSAV